MRREHRLALLIRISAIALLLVMWELAVRRGWVDSLFLAGPLEAAMRLGAVVGEARPDIAATLVEFGSAFVTGVVLAVTLGFAINHSPYATAVFKPLLVLGVTVPKVTLLPLFLLWFGIDKTPIIIFGALSGFFPMVVNVMAASTEIKPNQVLLARAMGHGKLSILRKVTLPAMLPVLSSGMFYACNAAMVGVFIIELAIGRNGLGVVVHGYAVTFQTPDLYAAVILTASISVAINMALWYTARYFGRWRR
ncbi:MAG TPA: ABC transporter permease subunit [Stellaceae bacterium]|nr:ABC transporter permease subunit [Stellaceae bacterium]